MKICLVGSAGGHLTQLLELEDVWKKYDSFYVTYKRESSKNLSQIRKTYFVKDPIRNPLYLFLTFLQSLYILLMENPDIIITTGAGVAISITLLGKFFGKKIVFIESLSRVENPSITGKILYHISDLFLVQWKSLLKKYGQKAKYRGRVL
jgi:UDP-N-acetylglucosamine:LPS N-acetylglucosamine transferase